MFGAGLRVVLEQWPFVGHSSLVVDVVQGDGGVGVSVGVRVHRLSSNAQRLVGLGERPVRGVVVGIRLDDRRLARRAEGLETRPDRLEGRRNLDLEFDFVHTSIEGRGP